MDSPVYTRGQRVQYRHYSTAYTDPTSDRVDSREEIRCGAVVTVHGRYVAVRSDASGLIVNVLHQRILK